MKPRDLPWLVMTKVNGSFWQANISRFTEEKAKQEALAFERGGYLARVIRDGFEVVSGLSYRCVAVR